MSYNKKSSFTELEFERSQKAEKIKWNILTIQPNKWKLSYDYDNKRKYALFEAPLLGQKKGTENLEAKMIVYFRGGSEDILTVEQCDSAQVWIAKTSKAKDYDEHLFSYQPNEATEISTVVLNQLKAYHDIKSKSHNTTQKRLEKNLRGLNELEKLLEEIKEKLLSRLR